LVSALQRQNTENLKQIFLEKEYGGLSSNFHIHVSLSELYIPTICLPILLQEIAYRHMDVKIGTGVVQFPEKEYINGILLQYDIPAGDGNVTNLFLRGTQV
jgi:hypothetical protein